MGPVRWVEHGTCLTLWWGLFSMGRVGLNMGVRESRPEAANAQAGAGGAMWKRAHQTLSACSQLATAMRGIHSTHMLGVLVLAQRQPQVVVLASGEKLAAYLTASCDVKPVANAHECRVTVSGTLTDVQIEWTP